MEGRREKSLFSHEYITRTKLPWLFWPFSHQTEEREDELTQLQRGQEQLQPCEERDVWIIPGSINLHQGVQSQFNSALLQHFKQSLAGQSHHINNINMEQTLCTQLNLEQQSGIQLGGTDERRETQARKADSRGGKQMIINMILKIKTEQSVRVFGLDQREQPEIKSQMESKGKQSGVRGKWKYISDLWTQTRSQIFTGTEAVQNFFKKWKEFLSFVIAWKDLTFKHSSEEHSQIWLANKVLSILFLLPPGQCPSIL